MHKKAAESTARAEFSGIQNHVEKCRDEKEGCELWIHGQ